MAAGIKPIISQADLQQNISESLFNLQKEVTKIESGYSLQETTALKLAKELAKKVCDLREKILAGMGQESNIHETLKELPIPFSKAQALTKILTHSSIQFEDKLKHVLSKSTCIYWEIIGFQVSARGRRVYKEDVEKLTTDIQNVIKTLPKSEMKTRFALKCCEATAKRLQPGEGKAKEIFKDFAPEMAKGALESVFSRNPSPIVSPLVDLSMRIYREIELKWYRHTWAVNWGKRPETEEEFSQLINYTNSKSEKNKTYFCLVSVIVKVFKESSHLRKHVLKDSDLSLINLAEKSPDDETWKLWKRKDKYWKVRCCSLQAIQKVLKHDPSYISNDLITLASRRMFDPNKYVCTQARETLQEIFNLKEEAKQEIAIPQEAEGLEAKIQQQEQREEEIRQKREVNLEQQEAAEERSEYRKPQSFKHQNQEPPKTQQELQKEDQALMDQLAEAQTNRELLETQLENKKLLESLLKA